MDELLNRQHGVMTMAQALEFLSRKAIRHRISARRWQEPHRSVFVTHNGPIGLAQQRWIAVLAIGEHAVLGGMTAAQAWGLRGFTDTAVHVLIPASRQPARVPAGVVMHRTSSPMGPDVLTDGQPPRTKGARSLVDAAQWARTDDEARAIIASAFQQRLTTAGDLHEVLARLPRARRRKLITETISDAAGGAHSLAEIDFLALCRKHGLPEPSRQVLRCDAGGRRRYLDALFDEWSVHVEIDGSQHLDARHAWADMRRQNEVWIAGDRVLRFPAWTLRRAPDEVITQLCAALSAAGWRGRL